VADLMFKAYSTSEELTDVEAFRLSRAFFLRFRHGDMAYFQYERGVIDEDRLRSALRPLSLGEPHARAFWERHQDNFTKGYQDYLNALIETEYSPE